MQRIQVKWLVNQNWSGFFFFFLEHSLIRSAFIGRFCGSDGSMWNVSGYK